MKILAIETSCDETAVSVLEGQNGNLNVLSNAVSSQIELHKEWGGVVPNLAAREHLKNIIPVLETALSKAKTKQEDIDLIAVTQGPGLIPALLVGVDAAKTLSYVWQKPLIGIHHIEGHIYANFISENKVNSIFNFQFSKFKTKNSKQNTKYQILNTKYKFPMLCLVVSGGHTQLVLMRDHLEYEIIGETQDDAAGEAFDKVARILGLGYPGGPAIAAAAANFQFTIFNLQKKSNNKKSNTQIKFPRPMLHSNDFNFSFSGLKTAVLYLSKEFEKNSKLQIPNHKLQEAIAAEFQQAVIDVLVHKTIKAAEKYNPKTIMLAGGVSANKELRDQLGEKIKETLPTTSYNLPPNPYSLDNAAMIASAAYFRWQKMSQTEKNSAKENWKTLEANAGLRMNDEL